MLIHSRDRFLLLSYFLGVILLGSLLLSLPAAWSGPEGLRYIDALFTSTSAVCVTGLISVNTALYTTFGRVVIMLLIQLGGLGIIAFMTIYLARPRGKISLVNRKLIGDYFLDDLVQNPRQIIRKVILFTLTIELTGSLILYASFSRTVPQGAFFASLFHAVSAFCNAGFSLFSTNLEGYVTDPVVSLTICGLIVIGGLGFLVHEDLLGRITGRRRRLTVHTRLVLRMTGALLLVGLVGFLALEWNGCMRTLGPLAKVQAALFASVTPRTAGFDTCTSAHPPPPRAAASRPPRSS
jgi:trk system potassium uptake protein TrkH